MTAPMIGLLIGAFAGIVSWRMLAVLAERVEMPETKKLLKIVGVSELVLLPVLGYVVATLAFGEQV